MIRIVCSWLPLLVVAVCVGSAAGQEIASQRGFGTSVAVAGIDVLIGEPLNERIGGIVYVYRKNNAGEWADYQKLSADDGHPNDHFGSSVYVDGDMVAVSAVKSDEASGAVYIFERGDDDTWFQQAKIQPDSVRPGSHFGAGLALDDNRLFASEISGGEQGKVYVFERTGADWEQVAILEGEPSADNIMFGATIEASRDRLFVGSPSNGNGVVYVYNRNEDSDSWTLAQTLVGRQADNDGGAAQRRSQGLGGGPASDLFGSALFAKGPYLLVSAPNIHQGSGLVQFYQVDDSGLYQRVVQLQPFDAQPRHLFGRAIAYSAGQFLIGSVGADDFTGAIYAVEFDVDKSSFTASRKFAPEGLDRATMFGTSVAANELVAVVGASRESQQYGNAYIYEPAAAGGWAMAARVGSELQGSPESINGDVVECEDGTAAAYGCENVDLISFVSRKDLGADGSVRMNDVWGWTDPETEKEYVLAGRTDGTSFIDISDPGHPIVVGHLPRTTGTPESLWRDIKVFKDHAFIVADGAGAHGVQIFDLSQLGRAEDIPVTFDESAHYDGIHSAHNIVINESTGFAYAVGNSAGGDTCAGGSHMINIQDPLKPTFAGCFAHKETGRSGTGYTHDGQCVTYDGPDERYLEHEICFGANETAISIADVSDKDNPIAISTGRYPNPGYTHQGWLSEDHRYFFVNDELDELYGSTDGTRTLIWDVAELDDPLLINEYVSENKATDHNLYIRGNYMYQSNYASGLRVIDVSDVEHPVEVGFFDTVNWGEDRPGFGGSWSNYPFFKSGVIAVTSGEEGVFFLKRSDVDI